MLEFIEKTWVLWWIFAAVVILRWIRVSSCDGDWDKAREVRATVQESGRDRPDSRFSSPAGIEPLTGH